MSQNSMTIRIGGEAGQGVESGGAGLAKALSRGGLFVYGLPDYMSRIRGGHNFYSIRVSEEPLYSHVDRVDLLVALNEETIDIHRNDIGAGGGVVYDEGLDVDERSLEAGGIKPFPVPLKAIAEEAGNRIMANTASFGAVAGITGYDLEPIASVIRDNFSRKGEAVVEANLEVARRAHQYSQERYRDFEHRLHPVEAPKRMVINGNQAISLGALLAGCRWVSAYPMTPSTGIIEWMSKHASKYGVVTKHVEDELAAILMAIGANHVGVRGMAATSGGGFSLMTEALGLAGITETPLVIVEAQRPGPATGMPTRTEQGDLMFVLHASQGEFPRIVLAPGTTEECFRAGWRAFNLAEKYQCPAIILTDNYLANSTRSIEMSDFRPRDVEVDRGELLTGEDLDRLSQPYKRYRITPSGISPRALPGHPDAIVMACSDEHDDYGHIEAEDAENRIQMVEKRLRKLDAAQAEMRPPALCGPEEADTTFVAWGSSYGPVREAMERLNDDGGSFNFLHFTDVWPLPADRAMPFLQSAKRLVSVEGNATGQFARLLRAYTGVKVDQEIHRYDGRPVSPEHVLKHLERTG